MHFTYLSLSLCGLSAINALPTSPHYVYAVKESHAVPRGWTEVGPVSRSDGVHLQIGLKQRNEGGIEQHLLEISDPNNARHGQHLTPAEVRDIVSPHPDAMKLVYAWLLHNITEEDAVLGPSGDWISILLPIARVEQLLETQYKFFKYEESGETISRAPEWSLPVDLHEYIDVVQPTTSFLRGGKKRVDFRKRGLRESNMAELVNKQVSEIHARKDPIFDVCSVRKSSPTSYCFLALTRSMAFLVNLTTPRCLRTLYGTLHHKTQAANKNSIAVTNYLNETNRREDIHVFLKTFRPEIVSSLF
jgi:tripeptidyl-peptidase-1